MKSILVAITGSPVFTNYEWFCAEMDKVVVKLGDKIKIRGILTGNNDGVDLCAKTWFKNEHCTFECAGTDKYDKMICADLIITFATITKSGKVNQFHEAAKKAGKKYYHRVYDARRNYTTIDCPNHLRRIEKLVSQNLGYIRSLITLPARPTRPIRPDEAFGESFEFLVISEAAFGMGFFPGQVEKQIEVPAFIGSQGGTNSSYDRKRENKFWDGEKYVTASDYNGQYFRVQKYTGITLEFQQTGSGIRVTAKDYDNRAIYGSRLKIFPVRLDELMNNIEVGVPA